MIITLLGFRISSPAEIFTSAKRGLGSQLQLSFITASFLPWFPLAPAETTHLQTRKE